MHSNKPRKLSIIVKVCVRGSYWQQEATMLNANKQRLQISIIKQAQEAKIAVGQRDSHDTS